MDLKGVGVSQFWKVKDFVQSAASSKPIAVLHIQRRKS